MTNSSELNPKPFVVKNEACISSKDLFESRKEVLIVHNELVYRLKETNAGKLILTK